MGRGRLNYNNAGGYFEYLDGTRKVWRSDAAPAFLLPPADALTATVSLAYPDFGTKGNGMWYGVQQSTGNPDIYFYGNGLFEITRGGHDWGPAGSGAYSLARTYIGSVPSGCNYLDVAAVFTHTSPAPGDSFGTSYWGFAPIVDHQKPGKSVQLDGGFAPLEGTQAWRRAMAVVKDSDGKVYVERYQSIEANVNWATVAGTILKSGTQVYTGGATGPWNNFLTHDGDPSGWVSALIGGSQNNNVYGMRGGAAQPTVDPSLAATDYRSTWSVALTIRPGYAHT